MNTQTETLAGKKLLILGGAVLHCELVNTAKRLGVETYVTDYLPMEQAPAKRVADHAWDLNITDVDAIVARCREEKIDGVINMYYDPCQRPYQAICERLGLPCFGTREQYEIFTDKKRFLKTCVEHGLDIIPQYREEDLSFDNPAVEYPLYIKPADSRGSRGQSVCRCYAEVAPAIEKARCESRNGEVVIERFMENALDIQLALLMIDGEPYLEESSDMYGCLDEHGQLLSYSVAILPSCREEFLIGQLRGKLGAVLKALGLRNAVVFLQAFLDGDKLRIYDPALRFPANVYENVLRDRFGIDVFAAMTEFALTGRFPSGLQEAQGILPRNGLVCFALRVYIRPGRISAVRGLEAVRKHPCVDYYVPAHKVGDLIEDWHDIRQSFSLIGFVVHSRKEAEEASRAIYETLQILDENGEDMKYPLPEAAWLSE